MQEGVPLQPISSASNSRQRNRQGQSVNWTSISSDEDIAIDDEFGDDASPLLYEDEEEDSFDKIEESGGESR